MRIGHGYDVHRFGDDQPGGNIRLGGVDVPSDRGVVAHSDGDVALHALCDALLGALALGDIGMIFPDTDAAFSGADSHDLLRETYRRITGSGYTLGNADITIIAQAPKVSPYREAMREAIAATLDVHAGLISVKATTTEKLGFLGRAEGIAAEAVVLVVPV